MNKLTKIQKLEREIIDLKLKNHTSNYIHIPKIDLLSLLGTIIFGLLSYLNLYLLDWKVLKIIFGDNEELIGSLTYNSLNQFWILIGEYVLLSLFFISLVATIKSGYKNLEKYDQTGLISGLIGGLISGLIGGLISGLIGGLIVGLISGLIVGLIVGLIGGLIFGLIVGLIGGLIDEVLK